MAAHQWSLVIVVLFVTTVFLSFTSALPSPTHGVGNHKSPMSDMPKEIFELIGRKLSPSDILSYRAINKEVKSIFPLDITTLYASKFRENEFVSQEKYYILCLLYQQEISQYYPNITDCFHAADQYDSTFAPQARMTALFAILTEGPESFPTVFEHFSDTAWSRPQRTQLLYYASSLATAREHGWFDLIWTQFCGVLEVGHMDLLPKECQFSLLLLEATGQATPLFSQALLADEAGYAEWRFAQSLFDKLNRAVLTIENIGIFSSNQMRNLVLEAIESGANLQGVMFQNAFLSIVARGDSARNPNFDAFIIQVLNLVPFANLREGGIYCSLLSSAKSLGVMRAALLRGAHPDGCTDLDEADRPLTNAINSQNVELMQLMLAFGADPNVELRDGTTLLMRAKTVPTAQVLIGAGADINDITDKSGTALHFASKFSKPDMVEFLIKAGANVHALDKNHETPLMQAQTPKVAQAIISSDPDTINDADLKGQTALHHFAYHGLGRTAENRETLIRILIQHGANIDSTDAAGRSALFYVSDPAVISFLIVKMNACISLKDRFGLTPLMYAKAQRSHDKVQQFYFLGASE